MLSSHLASRRSAFVTESPSSADKLSSVAGPLDLQTCIATSLAFYRSQKGLSLENSEKSPKRGSRGLSAPGSKKLKKSRKKVEKGQKTRKKLEK